MPTFKIHFTPAAEALLTEKPRPTNWADVEKLADEFEKESAARFAANLAARKAKAEANAAMFEALLAGVPTAEAAAGAGVPTAEAETEAAAGAGVPKTGRRCGICREIGHNKATCKATPHPPKAATLGGFEGKMKMIETGIGITPYTDIDDLLKPIARWAIKCKLYRNTAGIGRHFSRLEIAAMNRNYTGASRPGFRGGYVFVDSPEESTSGMIRLYTDSANPKWSFWEENGEIKVDYA